MFKPSFSQVLQISHAAAGAAAERAPVGGSALQRAARLAPRFVVVLEGSHVLDVEGFALLVEVVQRFAGKVLVMVRPLLLLQAAATVAAVG